MIAKNTQILATAILAWVYSAIGIFLFFTICVLVINLLPDGWFGVYWRGMFSPPFLIFAIPITLIITGLTSVLLLVLMFIFKKHILERSCWLAGIAAIAGLAFTSTWFGGQDVLIYVLLFAAPITACNWYAIHRLRISIANGDDGTDRIT